MSNIKDVAKLAGVSTATVSKYLNGIKLKEKNRAAVEDAIEKTGYKLNSIARGLRTSKSMTIGILIHELDNLFATSVVSAIENILLNEGYSTIICDYKSQKELEIQKLKFLRDKMVDGIIYVPTHITKEEIATIDLPIVFIDRMIDGINSDFVLIDNFSASYEATEYLIKNGHEKIGILCGPENLYTFRERLKGYKQAISDNKIKINNNMIITTDNNIKSGYSMALNLIEKRPTALFSTSYELTLGAIIAINEKNISIPADISFVGFDNLDIAKIVKPKLSIVTQPNEQIGKTAAEILLNKIKDKTASSEISTLKTNLIKQDSVKKI